VDVLVELELNVKRITLLVFIRVNWKVEKLVHGISAVEMIIHVASVEILNILGIKTLSRFY
jgi:hypothetical protein